MMPERLQKVSNPVNPYGAFAVFAARFVAGARFLAGPLAGAAGMSPISFAVANALLPSSTCLTPWARLRDQNSTRAPSSTTRSGGILKKSAAELALRAMNPNRRLRHRIMGAGPVGKRRMRPR